MIKGFRRFKITQPALLPRPLAICTLHQFSDTYTGCPSDSVSSTNFFSKSIPCTFRSRTRATSLTLYSSTSSQISAFSRWATACGSKDPFHTWGQGLLYSAAPRLWHSVPISVRWSTFLQIFNRGLKTYLFGYALQTFNFFKILNLNFMTLL